MSEELKRCPSESAGMIFEKDGKYLLFKRLKEPYGWAGIAGHLDGDSSMVTAVREAKEEVGVRVGSVELLFGPETIHPNPCSRGDCNAHVWHVYRALRWHGEPKICEPDNHVNLDWFSEDEIKKKFASEQHDPAWRYIFSKLGIL